MTVKRYVAMLALICMLTGCTFGVRSRTAVLIPAMSSAWSHVRIEATNGGLSEDAADNFAAALANDDGPGIIAQWPAVRSAASRDIRARADTGLVSAGVAASLTERLQNLDVAIAVLKQRPP